MRVLLVEEDTLPGAAIAQALRDAAYAVDRVQGGRSASGVPALGECGFVSLDLGPPGRDGLESPASWCSCRVPGRGEDWPGDAGGRRP